MGKIKVFALGGLNENGKNMYVVEVNKDIFVFDAGLKYDNERKLGIDYIIPSFDYLVKNRKRIKGVFITHGHDSHMGAISDLVQVIPEVNIYATKFTMEMIRKDLSEAGLSSKHLKEIRPHSKIDFKSNSIFPISVTHSIPDAVCFVLYTKDGAIVYTGDFVFDPTMQGNYKTDIGKLAYVGKQGVLCLLSESMYADKMGHTSPNNRVSSFIRDVFHKAEGRIIATIFPAHIYRLQEIFDEASKTNKKIVIMGKALQDSINNAISLKYLSIDSNKIGDLSNINDREVIILISDDKVKPYNNLERIIKGFDKYIKLKDDDTVFITEPTYPGIEKATALIMDEIAKLNCNAVSLSSKKHLLHHASREDLMLMINLMNPKYYFPVKGEYRLQYANAEVAEEVGIPKENIILKLNGDVCEFKNETLVENQEHIEVDDVLIDGKTSGDVGDLVLKDREMLGENGIVIVSCTLNKDTKEVLAGPEILTRGFVYVKDNQELIEKSKELSLNIVKDSIDLNTKKVDFTFIKTEIRDVLGKLYYKETGCKPMIITVVQEV